MYEPLITDSSKNYGNNRWLAFSKKLNRVVYLFSDLEYENWLQVETNPNVIDFCEQPLKMEVIRDGIKESSIVDMWVKYKDGEESFIEVKYSRDLQKDSVKKQIEIQESWCKVNQIQHLIKTENEIRQNPTKLSNLKLLLKQINNSVIVDSDSHNLIKNHISNFPKSIDQIAQETKIEFNKLLKILCNLINEGKIKCNLELYHIGKSLEVWR